MKHSQFKSKNQSYKIDYLLFYNKNTILISLGKLCDMIYLVVIDKNKTIICKDLKLVSHVPRCKRTGMHLADLKNPL